MLIPSVAAVIRDIEDASSFRKNHLERGGVCLAGAIEPGETPEQAICREVREETGLLVKPQEIIGVFGGGEFRYIYPGGDEAEYTVILYSCIPIGTSLEKLDPETRSLKYFAEGEMPELALPYPLTAFFP